MAKVESRIVCEQQVQKNDVILVDSTDSDYSFNDCEGNSSGADVEITITSAYFTSIKGL